MSQLLAFVCPPLAVLATGTRSDLVANIGLTALLFVPGVLHALRVVDDHETRRRYTELFRSLGPA